MDAEQGTQVSMGPEKELYAYWGAPEGLLHPCDDLVTPTPVGKMFTGTIQYTRDRYRRLADVPAKAGFRQAALIEVMQFYRTLIESGRDPKLTEGVLAGFGSSFRREDAFSGPGYCVARDGERALKMWIVGGFSLLANGIPYVAVKI